MFLRARSALGLGGSLALRVGVAAAIGAALAVLCAPFAAGTRRLAALALGLALLGVWWGSARLDELDRSLLAARIGEAGLAQVEVTGSARSGKFAVRVPVRVRRFDRSTVDEPARLELPLGRSPPQGAILEIVATLDAPQPADSDGGFDEAEYLRPAGRPHDPAGGLLPADRTARRRPGRHRPAAPLARGVDGPWAHGRTAGGDRGDRPRRGRAVERAAPRRLQGVRLVPLARRIGPERRVRRRRDPARRVDRGRAATRRASRCHRRRARIHRRSRLAAVRRPRGRRRAARLPSVARVAPVRPLVLPPRRRRGAPRGESVHAPRTGLPALVRRRRSDLRRRPANRAEARGLSASAEGRPGRRALGRLRPRHGARALAPLRRYSRSTRCSRMRSQRRSSRYFWGSR